MISGVGLGVLTCVFLYAALLILPYLRISGLFEMQMTADLSSSAPSAQAEGCGGGLLLLLLSYRELLINGGRAHVAPGSPPAPV